MDKSNKIKNSFEQLPFEEGATDGIWDKISSKLEASSNPTESNNKIKESFESIQHQENLTLLWDDIESALEVSRVWSKIKKSLEKNSKFNRRKKRSAQLGLAMVLLLCLRTCIPENTSPFYNISKHQQTLSSTSIDKSSQTVHNPFSPVFSPSTTNLKQSKNSLITNPIAGTLLPIKKKKQHKTLPNSQIISPKEQVFKPRYTSKQNESSKLTTEGIHLSNKPSKLTTLATTTSDALRQKPLKIAAKKPGRSTALPPPTNANDPRNLSAFEVTAPTLSILKVAHKLEPISTAKHLKHAKELNDLGLQDSSILAAFPVEIKKTKPKPRSELGLIGKLGSSILIGATTSKALELTSMVKTRILPATGFGMSFNYFINDYNSFYVHVFPFVSTKQYFGGYSREGRFYNKEIKINYFEFFIGYQRNLVNYHVLDKKSSLYIRTDYSLGYLSKSEEQLNKQSVNNLTKYQDIDHRIGLSLGSRHQINHIIVDYGLNGYLSLAPSLKAHPDISTSNTLIFGAYVGIYYTL
jgi:hypothetical protein